MLAVLPIWAYSFSIFYRYGHGGIICLKKISKLQEGIAVSFPIIVLMGIALLTTLASLQPLSMPLAGEATLLILIGSVLIAILAGPWKNLSRPAYPPGLIFAIMFQLYFLSTTINLPSLLQRAFLPADCYASNVQAGPVDHTTFSCAQKLGLCHYVAFACIPEPRRDVEMRGASLQNGFRMMETP